MEEKHDVEKVDDVMLPGFRFHPTKAKRLFCLTLA